MHRHVGRVGDQRTLAVEHGATEIQALLDVHRMSRVLQPQAHLLGNVHEQIVEDLEHHRIDACACIPYGGAYANSAHFQIAIGRGLRTPSRLDYGCGVALDDDRGAVDACTRREGIAKIQVCRAPTTLFVVGTVHAHCGARFRGVRRRNLAAKFGPARLTGGDAFQRHGLQHQSDLRREKREAPTVRALELRSNRGRRIRRRSRLRQFAGQCRVGAGVTDEHAAHGAYLVLGDTLPLQFPGGIGLKLRRERVRRPDALVGEIALERTVAHDDLIGQSQAVGAEDACQRMTEDPPHAQCVRDQARMLPAGSAEALQRV